MGNVMEELKVAMEKQGYSMEEIPEEFSEEIPESETYYVLKDGELHEE